MVKPSASRAVTVQNCKTTLRISDYKPYWENGDNGGGRRCGAQKPMRASHIAVAFARPYRPWRDGSRSDLRTARGGAWPWSSTRVQAVKAIARRLAARTQAGGRRLAARTLVEQARGDLPRLPTPAHRGRRQTGAHVAGAPPPAQRPPGPRPPGPLRRSRPQGRRRGPHERAAVVACRRQGLRSRTDRRGIGIAERHVLGALHRGGQMALPVVGHRHHDLVPRVVVGHALLAVVHLDDRVGVGAPPA